jgi:hypothetical protein
MWLLLAREKWKWMGLSELGLVFPFRNAKWICGKVACYLSLDYARNTPFG